MASTRERLIDRSRTLFCEEGYGVSVDAIADYAGVAKPTVYAHFASKEALIDAVLCTTTDQWFERINAEIERRAGDPMAQLLAPFELSAVELGTPGFHGCMVVNASATFAAPEHPGNRVYAAYGKGMLELFERLAEGVGASDPKAVARQLLLLFDGVRARSLVADADAATTDAVAAARALVA